MTEYVHPETGEILASEEDWRAALAAVEERLAPIYRVRRSLREQYASRFEAAALPARRNRTETQERVARCPRCGWKPGSSGAAELARIGGEHLGWSEEKIEELIRFFDLESEGPAQE